MSVENPDGTENSEIVAKPLNGDQEQRLNGLSNGHIEENNKHKSSSSSKHKSSSKDKYRDKDRDKDHKSSKSSSSSNRDKESDKHKSSSSSSKDKYRDKDKDKDKHKSSSSSHKSSTRDKDKEKDKDRDRDKDKDKEKSSRDKDRDKDKDKNKERSSDDKDKDRKKESKDKEKSSHSKDKEKSESSSKDKDRDKDKDRHKSSSSSNKDKHSSSSTSKSKDKDRDRDKHSSKDKERQREKDREREKRKEKERQSKNSEELKVENTQLENSIKSEEERDIPTNDYDQTCSGFNDIKPVVKLEKLEMTNMRQNHAFNISQASSCDYSMSQFRSDEPAFIIKGEVTDDSQDPLKIEPENEIENDIDDEEDVPLAKRKAPIVEDSDDDVPLGSRKKPKVVKKEKKAKKKKREEIEELDDEEYDEKPKKKKVKKEKQSAKVNTTATIQQPSPTKGGRKKKEEEPEDVWRWWEEEKREDGVKWTFLEHKGPVFAPAYVPLPSNVHFYYDGKLMKLSQDTEEVACFYAKMLNHDYVTKQVFNDNFFKDWRKFMTSKEKEHIKDLRKCNFKEMHDYFTAQSEKNKNRTKEEKLALKTENEATIQEYGFCIIDGHKERIGNFKIEPPGLFRGRGEHPKMGMVKRRVMPEEIHINCSKDSKIPQPPKGHRWKEVRHDNTVTWLASWTENIQGQVKYIMLNPSSKLKGEKDFQKYEIARRLDKIIDKIRSTYREEWKSKEMRIRQRGVALYFIDKLALRAGNEKDEDQADTVGCCSLRVEHVQLKKSYNGMENVVIFDFLGKDSIRYYNEVEVEKRVFKNLELFMENKKDGDDLFDRLNTSVLNEHLRDIMDGLTAKVFRTYNASVTLQNQLDLLTDPNSSIPEKLLSYNRANRAVAVLCNHQRAVPKTHAKSMENLKEKIRQKRECIEDAESELHDLQKSAKRGSVKEKLNADKKKKQVDRLKEQLKKLELQETDRDENKTIALGTSKLNYLDPRISVAWCKKNNVPIDKIFNKTQRDKFRWAIHMATEDYRF